MPKYTRGDFYEMESYLEGKFNQLKEILMTMGQATQDAINQLNVEVSELAATVAETVTKSEALRDQLLDAAAENATLEEKNATLTRVAGEMDALVAGQLRPFATRINDLDENLKNPQTPLSPTS